MTPDTLRLYKLIILYLLSRTRQGLTNAFVCDFILDHGYTDYFSIQETLSGLAEDQQITEEVTHKTTYYQITEQGMEMLDYFSSMLPTDTKRQIEEYLTSHKIDILDATTIHTDYTMTTSGEYITSGTVQEHGHTLLSVSITMPDEKAAQDACKKIAENQTEIYQYMLSILK